MAHIAYYWETRFGTACYRKREADPIAKEFVDEVEHGSVLAARRAGLRAAMEFAKPGDTLCVMSLDSLGMNAMDVQATLLQLRKNCVNVQVHKVGLVGNAVMQAIAQLAVMELDRHHDSIREKSPSKQPASNRVHDKPPRIGRPIGRAQDAKVNPESVAQWRLQSGASIDSTAKYWSISTATVKRYCASFAAQHPYARQSGGFEEAVDAHRRHLSAIA